METLNKMSPTPLDRMTQGMVSFGNAMANLTIAVLSLQTAWDTFHGKEAKGAFHYHRRELQDTTL